MKTPRLMIVVGLLATYTAVARAQDAGLPAGAGLLNRPAHLDVHRVSLETAIRQLSQRSGVPFAFSPDLLRRHGAVSCLCDAVKVSVALDSLLAGTGLVYVETDHRVVLGPPSTARPVVTPTPEPVQQAGTLAGHVRAGSDGQPIYGARVQVSGRLGEVRTDAAGLFQLALPPGTYDLLVQALAFAPQRLLGISIGHGDTTSVTVTLDPAPIRLDQFVVTPGTFGILQGGNVVIQQTLTREYVNALPRMADDIYRAIERLPGVTTHDITAKINVRGAPNDQVLVQLDGLELSEPFHLKDWDGSLSIIDAESLRRRAGHRWVHG
jgi:hypothetical protein